MNSFNISDVIVISIIILCGYVYYKKGLIYTILGFFSTVLAVILSKFLSPIVSTALKGSPVFDTIKEYVKTAIFQEMPVTSGVSSNSIIDNLNIPEFLKNALIENNNSSVYSKFNVSNIQDYTSEYITSFVINILAMIIVFILLMVLFKFLAKTLNIFSKLPIIRTANRLAGGALGVLQGVVIIWIGMAILTMLYGQPIFDSINESISESLIACKFYDSNIIIKGFSALNNLI